MSKNPSLVTAGKVHFVLRGAYSGVLLLLLVALNSTVVICYVKVRSWAPEGIEALLALIGFVIAPIAWVLLNLILLFAAGVGMAYGVGSVAFGTVWADPDKNPVSFMFRRLWLPLVVLLISLVSTIFSIVAVWTLYQAATNS